MMVLIALLLLAWLALAILGAVLEGLLWLMIVGAVLFIATAAYGLTKRRGARSLN